MERERQRRDKGRARLALILASLLHLAVGGMVRVWVGPAIPLSLAEAAPVAIVLEDEGLPSVPPPPRFESNRSHKEATQSSDTAGATRRVPRVPSTIDSVEAPVAANSLPVAPDDEAAWSLRVTNVDLGIDAHGRPSVVGQRSFRGTDPSDASPPASASTSGGLVEALDARDVDLGLGHGGLVRTAVEGAVQAADVMGVGTFSIRLDSSGQVSVGLADASSDATVWARLAESIRAGIVAKRGQLRLPPGARGLNVVVRAEAKDQFPDGRPPKSLGTRLEGTLGGVTETRTRINIRLPSATLGHVGKVCAVGLHVGFDGLGILGGCTPENLGTRAVRVVATRIVSESRL